MKNILLTTLCILAVLCTSGQSSPGQYVGMNVLQLPALTINANYSVELKPFLTPAVDIGYAFNYEGSFDFMGNLLTTHCKCGNDGYDIDKLTGAYLKVGTFLNLRKSFEKQNFFRAGLFLNNSIVNESGEYHPEGESGIVNQPVSHTIYIPGLSVSGGYEFSVFKRIKSGIDFQVSLPAGYYEDLFGYRNYIPGMGYRDIEKYWFPMLLWNLKYRL